MTSTTRAVRDIDGTVLPAAGGVLVSKDITITIDVETVLVG